MAQDIVPIELGLPQGDVVTLWAPRWREDGEDWEAFLGHEEDLYAFPDAAHLAAFVRSGSEHDLDDHPAWHVVPALSAVDLSADDDHQYDLVGVPELVSETPDTWTLGELADIVSMARSLAEVCELDTVNEVLDAAEGFDLLPQGSLPFTGKDGQRRWSALCQVVAERWDELLDAIDSVVSTPEVDEAAMATAEAELAEATESQSDSDGESPAEETEVDSSDEDSADSEDEADEERGFWRELGIDPIRIVTGTGDYYTLRCYLDDEPVFLGSQGRIDVFSSTRALNRFLADEQAVDATDLAQVSTCPKVVETATAGELEISVDPENTYVFSGLADDLAAGPSEVDPNQLDLAEELLTDAATWAGDKSVDEVLQPSQRLGWMMSFILRPSPNRLPPSAPFDVEVAAWQELVQQFENRLRVH